MLGKAHIPCTVRPQRPHTYMPTIITASGEASLLHVLPRPPSHTSDEVLLIHTHVTATLHTSDCWLPSYI